MQRIVLKVKRAIRRYLMEYMITQERCRWKSKFLYFEFFYSLFLSDHQGNLHEKKLPCSKNSKTNSYQDKQMDNLENHSIIKPSKAVWITITHKAIKISQTLFNSPRAQRQIPGILIEDQMEVQIIFRVCLVLMVQTHFSKWIDLFI